jgi:homoserine dehydrogenase
MRLLLPDPRDDLGGMDVARKVRYLTISHSIIGVLFVGFFFIS